MSNCHISGRWRRGSQRWPATAEGEHALLGARSLLVAPRAAEGRIEPTGVERLAERDRLHHVGIDRRRMVERVDIAREAIVIGVHDEIEPEIAHGLVAEGDHVAELPRRVDVQQREGRLGRPERFPREVQQNGRVLADRVEQHRCAELRRSLAENVNALGLEQLEMRYECGHAAFPLRFGFMWMPHSFFSSCSHHQRPARGSSPGCTARVHGAQPIETKPRACSGLTGTLLAAM